MSEITTDEYFGGCPECGDSSGYLNVGRDHWAVCDEHRTAWNFGANLFSSWHEETENDWRRNEAKLKTYRVVEPVRPDITNCPRCDAQTIHFRSEPMSFPHHPLCRKPDSDTLSPLTDEVVRTTIAHLESIGHHVAPNGQADAQEDTAIPF